MGSRYLFHILQIPFPHSRQEEGVRTIMGLSASLWHPPPHWKPIVFLSVLPTRLQLTSHWPEQCYSVIPNCKGFWEVLLTQCFSYGDGFSPPVTSLVCSVTSYIEYALSWCSARTSARFCLLPPFRATDAASLERYSLARQFVSINRFWNRKEKISRCCMARIIFYVMSHLNGSWTE